VHRVGSSGLEWIHCSVFVDFTASVQIVHRGDDLLLIVVSLDLLKQIAYHSNLAFLILDEVHALCLLRCLKELKIALRSELSHPQRNGLLKLVEVAAARHCSVGVLDNTAEGAHRVLKLVVLRRLITGRHFDP
jgi:hypothetical protein